MSHRARLVHDVKDDAHYLGWDQIAPHRDRQLRHGVDISYQQVLLPEVMRLFEGCGKARVIDVGCGTGVLTEKLAARSERVCAVDISPVSVDLARNSAARPANVDYFVSPIERFPARNRDLHGQFDTAVANMVLMDVVELDPALAAIHALLAPGGALVATITHPCFWPGYWGYDQALWFNYYRELVIAHPFVTHSDRFTVAETIHVHRPLERYVEALNDAGFVLEQLHEPLPMALVPAEYLATFRRPRFLSLLCRRQ